MLLSLFARAQDRGALRLLFHTLQAAAPGLRGVALLEGDPRQAPRIVDWYGAQVLSEQVGDARFQVGATAFFQVSGLAAARLTSLVLEGAALTGTERILELYSGVGTFSVPLAKKARELVGIEANPGAAADGEMNLRQNECARARIIQAQVEQALPGVAAEGPWDVVVLDPPRQGCSRGVLDLLASVRTTRLIYVSCDPSTLAQLKDFRALLEQARKDTLDALSRATKEWQVRDRKAVLASLDAALSVVNSKATASLTDVQTKAWNEGDLLPVAAAAAAGMMVTAGPRIDPSTVAIWALTTPELITGVTAKVRSDIASLLRQAALGQLSPLDVMKRMGTVAGKGPWASAFLRGEVIYRTEVGRMLTTAAHLRALELDKMDDGWLKEWRARPDTRTRDTHRRADGQRRKVTEPFDVGDSKLMYPHDPRGLARETINCRCVSVPVRPEWDSIGKEPSQAERARSEVEQAIDDFRAKTTAAHDAYDKALKAALAKEEDTWQGRSRATTAVEAERRARELAIRQARDEASARLRRIDPTLIPVSELRGFAAWLKATGTRLRLDAHKPGVFTDLIYHPVNTLRARVMAALPIRDRLSDHQPYTGRGSRGMNTVWKLAEQMAYALDDMGYQTNWSGGLNYGAGRAAATMSHDGWMAVNPSVFKYRPADQSKVILHELGHGVSNMAGGKDTYAAKRGWEEGVVEGWADVMHDSVNIAIGRAAAKGYDTYAAYTSALGFFQRQVGMSKSDFYTSLIRVPLNERPDWVRKRLPNDPATLPYLANAFKALST